MFFSVCFLLSRALAHQIHKVSDFSFAPYVYIEPFREILKCHVKGIVDPEIKILSSFMLFQTCMTDFLLWNIQYFEEL